MNVALKTAFEKTKHGAGVVKDTLANLGTQMIAGQEFVGNATAGERVDTDALFAAADERCAARRAARQASKKQNPYLSL